MILSEFADVRCGAVNKRHLVGLNYDWKFNEVISVKVCDLQPSSTVKVEAICDYCHEEGRIKRIDNYYFKITNMRKKNNKDCCYNCRSKKMKETCQKKYGVDNPSQAKELASSRERRARLSYEEVVRRFQEKGYHLVTKIYKSNKQKLQYICLKHSDKGEQTTTVSKLKRSGCWYCSLEKISATHSGKNSTFWKGGKSSLSQYLRNALTQWKNDSMKENGYYCVLSRQENNIEIHHLYSYNKIIDETLKELSLPILTNIGEYSPEQMNSIVEKCIEIHYRYPLGVCLSKGIHKLFHDQYGTENFTPEDFVEFAREFYEKKIDLIYKKGKRLKYYPYKKKGATKYTGIYKKKNGWSVYITHNRTREYNGTFRLEYDAAKAFNEKVIKLRGKHAMVNLLDDNDLTEDYYEYHRFNHEKYYPLQTDGTSRFYGVNLFKNKGDWENSFVTRLKLPNGNRHVIGHFKTEVEAAYHFNLKAIEIYGENAKLNLLTEEEIAFAEHLVRYFEHRKYEETLYTCVFFDGSSWTCGFTHEGKFHKVGRFPTDEEAALAYNYYVQQHFLERKLNFVEQPSFTKEDIRSYFEKDERYFKHNQNTKSIYSCVKQDPNGIWVARFTLNKKEIRIGSYSTDKEAAIGYNEYVLANNIPRKLNKII